MKGILALFEGEKPYERDTSKFYNPKIQKVSVIVEGKPNELYTQGMRSFEQYDETHKYLAEGKQKNDNANEVQKQLQLHDVSLGEYLTDRYALWLDFRTIDENDLHGIGRKIENASEGITLQIEKKEETAGSLNAYIYLIMDAQLNIQNGAFVSAIHQVTKNVYERTAYCIVRTSNWTLDLLETEYKESFDFIIIICLTLRYNKIYQLRNWIWTDPYIILIEPSNQLYYWIEKIGNLLAGSKTLFLIDDISANENLNKRRQPLLELAISGGHKGHSLWLLMQSYTAVPKISGDKQRCFMFGTVKTRE